MSFPRTLAYRLQRHAKTGIDAALGSLAVAMLRMIRATNRKRMADFAGGFMRTLGPRLKEHGIGRDNLAAALKPWGIAWKDVPFNMNVFMNCPICSDGNWSIQVPKSKAGDYIDFRAEMDVIAAFSNCPQVHNACNGFRLKPLKAVIYEYSPY